MVTQIVFKIDKKLKDKAMSKAQQQGIALASILKLATKAFAEGDLALGLMSSEKLNKKTTKQIQHAIKDISENKNISQPFSSSKEAITFLKK